MCIRDSLNTINFKKSMHYNPFAYIHSEKDILKLVTTLIANTKGERKAGDDVYGGRLPVHVRCLIDEAANIGQIPRLEKLVATIRRDVYKRQVKWWTTTPKRGLMG